MLDTLDPLPAADPPRVPLREGTGLARGGDDRVRARHIHALGRGQVLVYDARAAAVTKAEPGAHQGALGVTLHVLRPGDEFTLPERSAATPK